MNFKESLVKKNIFSS